MGLFDRVEPQFAKDTPVLRLSRGIVKDARWVLWPVLAWRVVAPIPTPRTLNLFQRAALRLARAGVTRAIDVSDRLLLAPDLAALVAHELEGMGLLSNAGVLTARGMKALEDIDDESADEVSVGHVLADPFTGKLWPRFLAGDLPIAEVEPGEEGWPVLLSGSAGDPWKDRTFSVLPHRQDTVVTTRPAAHEILRAARRHRGQRNRDEVDDERDVPRLQRVSFVDERPYPYMFALRVRGHDSGDWMVDDPFGRGESIEMRGRLETRLDAQAGLRQWLSLVIGSDPSAPTLGHLQAEAAWKVEERLTLSIRQHPDVHERLVVMQRAFLETAAPDVPPDKWDDVLVKAQRAVERMLHTVHERFRDPRVELASRLPRNDKWFVRDMLDAAAGAMGFRTPLPQTLSCVRQGKMQHAEQRGGGSLRPLVVLALLCADRTDQHPLRSAAASHPDLLHRLDALATARDRAAHDGAATSSQKVQSHLDTVYDAVHSLLLIV